MNSRNEHAIFLAISGSTTRERLAHSGEPLLLEQQKPNAADSPAPRDADETREAEERAILCAACNAPIARERDRTPVFGSHEHDRMNPSGDLFRIACFSRADGARVTGPSSDEFPWFPSHRWRYVHCGSCLVQLGWHFTSGTSAFFGLIVEKLVYP